jgi:hypothetical protein
VLQSAFYIFERLPEFLIDSVEQACPLDISMRELWMNADRMVEAAHRQRDATKGRKNLAPQNERLGVIRK